MWLMSGVVSVGLTLVERIRGLGVPGWIFWMVSIFCFFVASYLAWLDKDRELQHALGSAPEVVLEYECSEAKNPESRQKPLILRNVRGATAYHVQIEEIVAGPCSARFKEISPLTEGARVQVPAIVRDSSTKWGGEQAKALQHDFVQILEAAYRNWGGGFTPVRVPIYVRYADKNGRQYRTQCEIEFDYFTITARTTCNPPGRVAHLFPTG
jgi:hypothetical protein